eukprot:7387385-Prymnesium_polylepis.1
MAKRGHAEHEGAVITAVSSSPGAFDCQRDGVRGAGQRSTQPKESRKVAQPREVPQNQVSLIIAQSVDRAVSTGKSCEKRGFGLVNALACVAWAWARVLPCDRTGALPAGAGRVYTVECPESRGAAGAWALCTFQCINQL